MGDRLEPHPAVAGRVDTGVQRFFLHGLGWTCLDFGPFSMICGLCRVVFLGRPLLVALAPCSALFRFVSLCSTWKMGIFCMVLAHTAFDVLGHQGYALTGLGHSKSTSTRLPHAGPGYNRSDFQSYGHRVVSMKEQSAPVLSSVCRPMIGTSDFKLFFIFYMARL